MKGQSYSIIKLGYETITEYISRNVIELGAIHKRHHQISDFWPLELHPVSNTIMDNQNGWKGILSSKLGLLWAHINYLKSAATHFFKKCAIEKI